MAILIDNEHNDEQKLRAELERYEKETSDAIAEEETNARARRKAADKKFQIGGSAILIVIFIILFARYFMM